MKNNNLIILITIFSFFLTNINGQKKQPNIIIILTDDQGYQDLGCFGSPDISTPNLDNMANDGVRFTDFYVASSVCSPSRAALLTGKYPENVGVPKVLFPNRYKGKIGLDPKHITIAEILKPIGYATKAVGKWHLGDREKYLPTNQGFDTYFGIPYSNDMTSSKDMSYAENCLFREGYSLGNIKYEKGKVPLMRDKKCIEIPVDQTTITKRYTDESIQFISESAKKRQPFFLYLAHSMPHVPLFVSKKFRGKSKRGIYGDVIQEIDYNIGRILDHLKKLEIDENTLIVFTSDNGPWLVRREKGGCALPLFEGKMTHFEGGYRVPAIMKWPTMIPKGKVCNKLITTMDLMPTIAKITGVKLSSNMVIDGKDILDIIQVQKGSKTPHQYFFYQDFAVRSGNWKYHDKMIYKVPKTAREEKGPALYNLKNDIGETINLIKKYPEIAAKLSKALKEHSKK